MTIALYHRRHAAAAAHALMPHLMVHVTPLYADPFDLATIPVASLGARLGVLPEADQGRIMTTIDEMLRRT